MNTIQLITRVQMHTAFGPYGSKTPLSARRRCIRFWRLAGNGELELPFLNTISISL